MAYKLKRLSYGRKGRKVRRARRAMKRFRTRPMRRFTPRREVKWISYIGGEGSTAVAAVNRSNDESLLSASDYHVLFQYPSQGTTDTSRIGDSIFPIKIYVRLTLNCQVLTGDYPCYLRVMIFTIKTGTAGSINSFFGVPSKYNATNNTVNTEVVEKLYYDKVVKFDPKPGAGSGSSVHTPGFFTKINIRLKRPITFSNGSTTPKNDCDNFKIAFIGRNEDAVNTPIANAYWQTRFYWYD